jgi:hypothetical protein
VRQYFKEKPWTISSGHEARPVGGSSLVSVPSLLGSTPTFSGLMDFITESILIELLLFVVIVYCLWFIVGVLLC